MGIRTPGLVIANDALYQLSYTPELREHGYYGIKPTAGKRAVCLVARLPRANVVASSASSRYTAEQNTRPLVNLLELRGNPLPSENQIL